MPLPLLSLLGLAGLCVFSWVLSTNRKNVNWRLIGWGLGMQMLFALLVFRLPAGQSFFLTLNNGFVQVIEAAAMGPQFVFGPLAQGPGQAGSVGFVLATQALPLIVVFSGIIAVLYYIGAMQGLIRAFAWLFSRLLGTSGAESLCAASNIFVGIEATLTIKPYLRQMTRSEYCTILTAGMATVASNVIGAYWFMLHDQFPNITGHLVSASLLSAPAALIFAKLLLPEDDQPLSLGKDVQPHYDKQSNVFAAVIEGANSGMKLVLGIVALLLALVGMIHVVNLLLGAASSTLGAATPWTLEMLLGILFRPFVMAMGISWQESKLIGSIIGQRLILTEFASYGALANAIAANVISPRSAIITAYALCGFAHIPSMAIFVGGTAALVPERRAELTSVAPRALLAANLACLATGCIAGIFANAQIVLNQTAALP